MITKSEGTANYLVTNGNRGLPVGDIAPAPGGTWAFWPSVYRQPVSLKIAGEILTCLEELNA